VETAGAAGTQAVQTARTKAVAGMQLVLIHAVLDAGEAGRHKTDAAIIEAAEQTGFPLAGHDARGGGMRRGESCAVEMSEK